MRRHLCFIDTPTPGPIQPAAPEKFGGGIFIDPSLRLVSGDSSAKDAGGRRMFFPKTCWHGFGDDMSFLGVRQVSHVSRVRRARGLGHCLSRAEKALLY